MAGSPIPNIEADLVPWLTNFGPKLTHYAVTLTLDPMEVTQTRLEIDYLIYMLNVRLPYERQTLAATVEFKNFMKDGDAAAALPNDLPGTAAPPAYPPAVPGGILTRLRKLVQNIKTRPGYTETIGQDLGIIATGETTAPDAPTLALVNNKAGSVTLNWNKAGWSGVRVQSRSNGGAWLDLGVDLYSPFVDTRPLAAPGQPENREYRAAYLDGDTQLNGFSQVLETAVIP
jgi:hypothetical protein